MGIRYGRAFRIGRFSRSAGGGAPYVYPSHSALASTLSFTNITIANTTAVAMSAAAPTGTAENLSLDGLAIANTTGTYVVVPAERTGVAQNVSLDGLAVVDATGTRSPVADELWFSSDFENEDFSEWNPFSPGGFTISPDGYDVATPGGGFSAAKPLVNGQDTYGGFYVNLDNDLGLPWADEWWGQCAYSIDDIPDPWVEQKILMFNICDPVTNDREFQVLFSRSGTDGAYGIQLSRVGAWEDVPQPQGQHWLWIETSEFTQAGFWDVLRAHVRLNTTYDSSYLLGPGHGNGVVEFWVNDSLLYSNSTMNLRDNNYSYSARRLLISNDAPNWAGATTTAYFDKVQWASGSSVLMPMPSAPVLHTASGTATGTAQNLSMDGMAIANATGLLVLPGSATGTAETLLVSGIAIAGATGVLGAGPEYEEQFNTFPNPSQWGDSSNGTHTISHLPGGGWNGNGAIRNTVIANQPERDFGLYIGQNIHGIQGDELYVRYVFRCGPNMDGLTGTTGAQTNQSDSIIDDMKKIVVFPNDGDNIRPMVFSKVNGSGEHVLVSCDNANAAVCGAIDNDPGVFTWDSIYGSGGTPGPWVCIEYHVSTTAVSAIGTNDMTITESDGTVTTSQSASFGDRVASYPSQWDICEPMGYIKGNNRDAGDGYTSTDVTSETYLDMCDLAISSNPIGPPSGFVT